MLDLEAGIGIEGALGGRPSGADHQAAKGGNHRSVIGAQGRAWDPQLNACFLGSLSGNGAQARVGCNSPSDDQ